MVSISVKMEKYMKVSSLIIKNLVMAYKFMQMETYTLENSKIAKNTVMANSFGLTYRVKTPNKTNL